VAFFAPIWRCFNEVQPSRFGLKPPSARSSPRRRKAHQKNGFATPVDGFSLLVNFGGKLVDVHETACVFSVFKGN
jgi:hypothetical protein